MNFISYWFTPFAKHEIPSSIIWLAEEAERKATGRHVWRCFSPQTHAFFSNIVESPYYKVIEEWGSWREMQDRIEYEKSRSTS